MRRTAKIALFTLLACVGLSLVLSAGLLYSWQFVAEPNAAIITLGDFEVTASGLSTEPFLNVVAAWLLTAGALLIAGVAVVFAAAITMIAVAFAMFLVVGTVGMLASPLIVIALIVWLAVRSSRDAPAPLSSATQAANPGAAA